MRYIITFIQLIFLAIFIFLIVKGPMMMWLAIYAASLLIAILFGRIYCGYICPMNTMMIHLDNLLSKLNVKKKSAPKWLESGNFTWLALIVSILAMIVFKKVVHINLPILLIWLLISLIITFFYKAAVFHNLICPFEPLQRLFGRYAIFSHRVNDEKCTACRACIKVCPSDAVVIKERKAAIDKAVCHQCSNCRTACVKNAISYSK